MAVTLTFPAISDIINLKGLIMKFIDLSGERYGRLLVLKRAFNNKRNKIHWLCRCDCGKEVTVARNELRSGDTKSCGCYRVEKIQNPNIVKFTYHRKRIFTPNPRKKLSEQEYLDKMIKIFWSKVDKSKDCWIWLASKDKNGYGQFLYKNLRRAHKFSYFIHHGILEDGKIICHHCDNPSCINPDHLYAGTHQSNSDDKIARGRARYGSRLGRKNKKGAVAQAADCK